jgi:hypothetical protein
MKKFFQISTEIDEPALLQNLVEKLAVRRGGQFVGGQPLTPDYKSVETASSQTFVSGAIQIEEGEGSEAILIRVPFITQYQFTCVRESKDEYSLKWEMSLS